MKKRLKHPSTGWRVLRLIVGILLLLAGVVGGLLPVIQGWMFAVPGLLLLAPESRIIRKIVVKMRTKLHLRRRRRKAKKAAAREADLSAPGGLTGRK
jgi:uncharacterized membrane protein YbaN (DUF454 family)